LIKEKTSNKKEPKYGKPGRYLWKKQRAKIQQSKHPMRTKIMDFSIRTPLIPIPMRVTSNTQSMGKSPSKKEEEMMLGDLMSPLKKAKGNSTGFPW